MTLPPHILVHQATPLEYLEVQGSPATWIEGEPGPHGGGAPTAGVAFPCVLFLPGPGGEQSNAYRPKAIREPTLLFNPGPVLTRDSELMVAAPELAPWTGGISPARWQLVGDAQPFGPPGSVIGVQATLRQVQD